MATEQEFLPVQDTEAPSVTNAVATTSADDAESLITSNDPEHPANLIPSLCAQFYQLGWVTGTGGGTSMRSASNSSHIYIAPSGVQKERMRARDLFVMDYASRQYLRRPPDGLKPSACTPLFLAAYTKRQAGCCIHTHSTWAVLVTLLAEQSGDVENGHGVFRINKLEQIKGVGAGVGKGNLGYFDTLTVPIIENTAHEEDLTESLEKAMDLFPGTYAVLVKRHGVYVWGEDWKRAKTMCECLDYIFQLAVEMRKIGVDWISPV